MPPRRSAAAGGGASAPLLARLRPLADASHEKVKSKIKTKDATDRPPGGGLVNDAHASLPLDTIKNQGVADTEFPPTHEVALKATGTRSVHLAFLERTRDARSPHSSGVVARSKSVWSKRGGLKSNTYGDRLGHTTIERRHCGQRLRSGRYASGLQGVEQPLLRPVRVRSDRVTTWLLIPMMIGMIDVGRLYGDWRKDAKTFPGHRNRPTH